MKTKILVNSEGFKLDTGMNVANIKEEKLALFATQNGNAAFQVVVVPDKKIAINVSKEPFISHDLKVENLRIEAQCKLDVKINHIGMVNGCNGFYYADAFLSESVVEVDVNKASSIFFEVEIPEDFADDSLDITILGYENKIFSPEIKVYEKTLTVDIIKYKMPKPSEYKLYLDLWQHNTILARTFKVPLFGDEHFEIIEQYIKTLADLGQKAITVIVCEAPWSGQRCFIRNTNADNLFEYSMIKIQATDKGFTYDFDVLDRYIKLCLKHNINKEIEVFGLTGIWRADDLGFGKIADDFIEAVRVRYRDVDGSYKYMDKGSDIIDYIRAIEQYFIENNYINIVKVIADEPEDKEAYKQSLELLHKITPNFKYKSALASAGFLEEIYDSVSDFAPSFQVLAKEFKPFHNKMMQKDDNKKYLWYVCLTPDKPNTLVYSKPTESRYIGLATYLFKADGFLRWSYYGFLKDPIDHSAFRDFPAGDCSLIYFSKTGKPMLSLRYKAFKRGIEDYELLIRLEKNSPNDIDKVLDMMLSPKGNKAFKADFKNVVNGDKINLDIPDSPKNTYSNIDLAKQYMLNILKNY